MIIVKETKCLSLVFFLVYILVNVLFFVILFTIGNLIVSLSQLYMDFPFLAVYLSNYFVPNLMRLSWGGRVSGNFPSNLRQYRQNINRLCHSNVTSEKQFALKKEDFLVLVAVQLHKCLSLVSSYSPGVKPKVELMTSAIAISLLGIVTPSN